MKKTQLPSLMQILMIALFGMELCRWCGRGRIVKNDLCEHCNQPFDPLDMG